MKTSNLIFFFMLYWMPAALAGVSDCPLREVIYDGSNPGLSVAVMSDELLEMGNLYENTRVIGLEPEAVVLHNMENDEAVKCLVQEKMPTDPKLHRLAVEHFIYKQMAAIHEAQANYWTQFDHTYAPDLQTLVHHGFLKGFDHGIKQHYRFEVVETGKTRNRALIPSEATYLAVATPVENAESNLIFTVNRLGEVRYGATRIEAGWGPVWEYSEHLTGPKQEIIREI